MCQSMRQFNMIKCLFNTHIDLFSLFVQFNSDRFDSIWKEKKTNWRGKSLFILVDELPLGFFHCSIEWKDHSFLFSLIIEWIIDSIHWRHSSFSSLRSDLHVEMWFIFFHIESQVRLTRKKLSFRIQSDLRVRSHRIEISLNICSIDSSQREEEEQEEQEENNDRTCFYQDQQE